MKPNIIPADGALPRGDRSSWLQRSGRRLFLQKLAGLKQGELTVIDGADRWSFGQRDAAAPRATIEVLHPQTYADAAFGGTVGAGEAYIRGLWRADDLTALVRLFVLNREVMESMEGGAAIATAPLRRVLHFLNRNSRDGSRRNIAAHYDLGNELFELFLDETMAYSCGVFEHENATLEQAQIAKYERICRKLSLQPTDRVLEVGTGWGGFERTRAAGLEDRITLLLEDYRDLSGRFDKLVSIEMIEAVGPQYLDTYTAKCSSLLEPHGAMLLQAITIQDQFYEQALKSVDYIQRYIFPGSFIPSVTAIGGSLRRATDMKLFHLEDIGPHYATTLRRWRERFMSRLNDVRRLGYPESFIRMWEFYLCYCEGGYAERQLGNVQMLLTRPRCRLPSYG